MPRQPKGSMRVPGGPERRTPSRRSVLIDPALGAALAGELTFLGFAVTRRQDSQAGASAALHVVPASESMLAQLSDSPSTGCLVVVGVADDSVLEKIALLTPHYYDANLPPAVLARFLEHLAEFHGRARRGSAKPAPLAFTIFVSECIVEVDGRPIPLGDAERNFLIDLAWSNDALVPKTKPIQVMNSPQVKASECRRRLGKRLGATLAGMLVPEERGRPYRLRTQAELDDMAAGIRLRVVGRSSVRASLHDDMDRFPDR